MPFNISPSSYQGGSFLFAGLSSVGDKAAEAIKQLEDNRKLDSYNDTVVQHAFQNNQMSREDYDKYIGSSRTQKTGIAAGLAANFVEDMKAEQLRSMKEQRQASIEARQATAEYRQQQAQALNWQPTQQDLEQARWTGNELVRTGPGRYTPVPYGGSGQDEVVTDPLVISGQTIPGIGVNRKTGQYVYFGGTGNTQIDPVTGAPYNVGPKGERKYVPAQTIMGGQMMPQATPAPTPGRFDRAWNWITGGGQQPAATPAPAQTPAPDEAVPVTTAAPAPAAKSAKADPRAEAAAYLQAHGLPVTEANIQHYIKNASKSK